MTLPRSVSKVEVTLKSAVTGEKRFFLAIEAPNMYTTHSPF